MPVDVLSVTLRAASFLTLFQAAGIALFLALREQQLPNTVPHCAGSEPWRRSSPRASSLLTTSSRPPA